MINRLKSLTSSNSSGFGSKALLLISGTSAGQLLVILSSPILTRFYTPDDFGTLGVYSALVAAVVLISSFRYELAIPLPDKRNEAVNVFVLSLILCLIVFVILSLVLWLFSEPIFSLLNTPSLSGYSWIIALGVLVGGIHKVNTYWAIREEKFGLISKTRLQRGGGMALTQLSMGYFSFGTLGLISGHVVGFGAGLFSLIRFSIQSCRPDFKKLSYSQMKSSMYRYRNFPLFSTWASLANVISVQFPPVLFAIMFSPAVAGFYLIAHRVANAPTAIIAEAVGKVFMRSAVDFKKENKLAEFALKIYSSLVRVIVVPLAILGVIAPDLFGIIFGTEWFVSGQYLQYMVPWISAVFIFVPLFTLCDVLEKQKGNLYFQCVLILILFTTMFIGNRLDDALLTVALFGVSAFTAYVSFGFWLLREAGVKIKRLMSLLLIELLWTLPGVVSLLVWKELMPGDSAEGLSLNLIGFFILAIGFLIVSFLRMRPALKNLMKPS